MVGAPLLLYLALNSSNLFVTSSKPFVTSSGLIFAASTYRVLPLNSSRVRLVKMDSWEVALRILFLPIVLTSGDWDKYFVFSGCQTGVVLVQAKNDVFCAVSSGHEF